MIYPRSVRVRILALVLATVIPVFLLALVFSFERELSLRRFRDHAAGAAIQLVTERLGRLIERASALGAALDRNAGEDCRSFSHRLETVTGFDAAMLIGVDGPRCDTERNGHRTLSAAVVETLKAGLSRGEEIALANDGDLAGGLAIGLHPGGASLGLLVLLASQKETDRIFEISASSFFDGLVLLDLDRPPSAGAVVERHASGVRDHWWPVGVVRGSKATDASFAPLHALDDSKKYRFNSVDSARNLVVAGLQAHPFPGADYSPLSTSLIQLLAILVATVVGALWAVDRSVLRWIRYLRRVAIVHSRGHYSVRVRRLTAAPTEFADLGEALNLMANDAGSRVAMLRKSATDKSALLLELHHRVKNSLQVVTSLLSLLRQDMPVTPSEELRFVEGFVHAMAVAYRVAYDAGDVTGVVAQSLIRHVVEALRALSGASPERIEVLLESDPVWLELDMAISLSLYLSVTLPPYLDSLARDGTLQLKIAASGDESHLQISIAGGLEGMSDRPPLRRRLRNAYLRQLKAAVVGNVIRIPFNQERGAHRLAEISTPEEPSVPELVDPLVIARGYQQAASGAGLMLSSQDRELRYRWASGAGLLGQSADSITGMTDSELLPPTAAAAMARVKLGVLADGEPRRSVLHVKGPTADRWFAIHVLPTRDMLDRTSGVLTVCHEVTENKVAETRMTLLVREMTHRLKNILAVTEAISRQSLAHATSLDDFGNRFSERLHSLANAHNLLTQRNWEGGPLRDLIQSQLGHYLVGEPPQITIDGPNVFLDSNAIPYLGLALHELSTNAAKHGALSVPKGKVAISWESRPTPEGKHHLSLQWIESGGPPVRAPAKRGFGTDLTKRIVSRALRGAVDVEFAPGGVVWRFDFPAANVTHHQT